MNSKEDILKSCVVDGKTVKLPPVQIDRKVYLEVAKSLNLIGGKWKGGKVQAFVFDSCPKELLESIQGGETRNLKKEFQFFATPPDLADYLVELAEPQRGDTILEPSAGQGAIVDAIRRVFGDDATVNCYELMDTNRLILRKNPCANIIGEDFLKSEDTDFYNIIIANPPFSKNQDIEHFNHMVTHLRPGGRLVCVMSPHWTFSKNKKETAFREFVEENCTVFDIDSGTFKESGTMVGAKIVVFDKQ